MSTTNRTACTTSLAYFTTEAKPLTVTITDPSGKVVFQGVLSPKAFSTGSFGWGLSEKATVGVGPVDQLKVQLGFNATVVGSKDAPREVKATA